MTQFVEGWMGVLVQLSVSEKSPLAVMPEKVTGVVPLFVAVIDIGALLATPTCCCPNVRLAAESVSVEACPFNDTTTFWAKFVAVTSIGIDALRSPAAWGA